MSCHPSPRYEPSAGIRKSPKSRLAVFCLLGVAVIGGVIYWAMHSGCIVPFAPPETASFTRAEERELLTQALSLWREENAPASKLLRVVHNRTPLPRPDRIVVSGTTATISVAAKMYTADFQYAAAWHEIYNKHHGSNHCVNVRVQWPNGHVDQRFPVSEF